MMISKKKNINFDANATTPPLKCVKSRLKEIYSGKYANPSAIYLDGRRAMNVVEEARKRIADVLGCDSEEIFFTSGASESNTWVSKIVPIAADSRSHHSVMEAARNSRGLKNKKVFKAVPLVVSETGICLKNEISFDIYNGYFVDLTQAIGKVYINLHNMTNVGFASASGHKFGGILGCGILYVKRDLQKYMKPLIYGSQENGLRGGTYNLPAIECFSIAIQEANKNIEKKNKYISSLIYDIVSNDVLKRVKVHSSLNTINITFKKLSSASAVQIFDNYGFNISAGSACMSGDEKPSEAYLASGYNYDEAMRTIRISLSCYNTKREVKKFIKVLEEILDNYDN